MADRPAGSAWQERAPEIDRMIREGWTNAQMAVHYDVSVKTFRNQVGRLRAEGLVTAKRGEGGKVERNRPTLENAVEQAITDYGAKIEISADGSHKSDRLLRMSAENAKDVNYLLDAHGYDRNSWELVSARSNIWNVADKVNGVQTLYASKITVKPRHQEWTFNDLLEAVRCAPAIHIPESFATSSTGRMLEIPLYDTHFGISNLELYRGTQSDTLDFLRKKKWEEVEITIGQDLLHNDNFRGTTANGTQIEEVDIPDAWADALRFYAPIIAVAKRQAQSVKIIYSKGNHDESMSWAFVQNLRSLFPWAKYDHRVEERKVHMFHHIFLGITHGEKTPARELVTLFATEFAEQWAQATTREIHKGHYHKEDSKDDYGSMVRTLATRNKTDVWHKNHGFTRAHKRFQLFEWDHHELKHIHYV